MFFFSRAAAFSAASLLGAAFVSHAAEPAGAPASPPAKKHRAGIFGDTVIGAEVSARPEKFRFSVESAVARALAESADLRAVSYIINEAIARRDGAGRLENPEIEIGAGPGLHAKGSAYFEANLRQKFPLSSRLRLSREIGDIEIAAAKEETLIARRRLIGEVKRDSVRLLALRAEITLLKRRADIAGELAAAARARVARGEGAETEAGFLEVESAAYVDEIARLESERVALLAEWRVEIGLKADADADLEGDIPAARDDYGLPDPAACPECRKLTLLAESTQKEVELEVARRAGDITVGLFGQLQHDQGANSHENQTFVGVKVAVPIPIWNDNSGGIAAARSRRERIRGELIAEVRRLDGEAMAARREYEKLSARLPDLVEKLGPAAAAQTARVQAALARGEGDPADLYRALDKQTEIGRRTLALRRDIALALVKLEVALSAHPALKEPVVTPGLPE